MGASEVQSVCYGQLTITHNLQSECCMSLFEVHSTHAYDWDADLLRQLLRELNRGLCDSQHRLVDVVGHYAV